MLTAMTDEDWTIVLQVFAASRSRLELANRLFDACPRLVECFRNRPYVTPSSISSPDHCSVARTAENRSTACGIKTGTMWVGLIITGSRAACRDAASDEVYALTRPTAVVRQAINEKTPSR